MLFPDFRQDYVSHLRYIATYLEATSWWLVGISPNLLLSGKSPSTASRPLGLMFVFVNMGSYGSKNLDATPPSNPCLMFFKFLLIFLLTGPCKNTVWDF